jgi:large subunit ribosomal protein L22
MNKKGARIVLKTLRSAVANAKQKTMDENRLVVRYAFVDGGPVFKRFRTRSMGRADQVIKRTAHLTVVLEEGRLRQAAPGAGFKEKKGGAAITKKTKEPKKLAAAAA